MSNYSNIRFILDNPGAGHCGFYSFANNLIDIIQKSPNSATAKHIIKQLLPSGISDEKQRNSYEDELTKALLNTSWMGTYKPLNISIPLQNDDKTTTYSLDDYLIKRLRALSAHAVSSP